MENMSKKNKGYSFVRLRNHATSWVTLLILILGTLVLMAWLGIFAVDVYAQTIRAKVTENSWTCDRIPEECAKGYWHDYCTTNPEECNG
jgi:hypothetical protein